MTTLKRYEGKGAEDPGKDLAEKALAYMEENPGVSYQDASDIVFKKNPELAKSYAKGDEPEPEKKEYSEDDKNIDITELDPSVEMVRLTEINMLKFNLAYAEANEIVCKENPALLKRYVAKFE